MEFSRVHEQKVHSSKLHMVFVINASLCIMNWGTRLKNISTQTQTLLLARFHRSHISTMKNEPLNGCVGGEFISILEEMCVCQALTHINHMLKMICAGKFLIRPKKKKTKRTEQWCIEWLLKWIINSARRIDRFGCLAFHSFRRCPPLEQPPPSLLTPPKPVKTKQATKVI